MKNVIFVILSIGLIFSLNVKSVFSAPVQWNTGVNHNDHYYERVQLSYTISWTTAQQLAAERYTLFPDFTESYLAVITSTEENSFVQALFLNPEPQYRAWLGGFQDDSQNPASGWGWVTGELWDYTNWRPGEPNDALGARDERYLETFPSGNWNDITLDGENLVYAFIVEYVPKPIPEPITLVLFSSSLLVLKLRKLFNFIS
ncbi:MAG: lectin-like protein [Candidatus Auribacterota bacterium]